MHRPGLYRRWLSAEGYLGLHLAVGLVLALAAGVAFDLIEDAVFTTADIRHADARAQAVARRLESPGTTAAMQAVSMFGTMPMLASMSLIVMAWLLKAKSHRRLYAFVGAMLGGGILNGLLKAYFHRARPDSPLVVAHGFSFPSGHSMGSMLFFGSLAYVIYFTIERHHVWRVVAGVACGLAVLAIGASRIYLGVHYFSDVVAGYAAGLCWMAVCLSGTEGWVRWRDYRRVRRDAAVKAVATKAGAVLIALLAGTAAMAETPARPGCAACVAWEATPAQAEALLAGADDLAGLDVVLPVGEEGPLPGTARRLRERGARVGLLILMAPEGTGTDAQAFRLKTRATELRAQEPAALVGLDAPPAAWPALRERGIAVYLDFVTTAAAEGAPDSGGVPAWLRLGGAPSASAVLAATANPSGYRVLAPAAPDLVLAVARPPAASGPADTSAAVRFAATVEVSAERRLGVEEVIARHQAAAARQARQVRSLVAAGHTVISFQVPGLAPPMTITSETVVYQAPGVSEVEQREVRLNGLAYGTGDGGVPRLPIIEPERVSAPPLAIALTEAYRYRLEGRERRPDGDAYVVAFAPKAGGASLFRGRAWIDAAGFAMVRVEASQTALKGPIVSSQQEDEFVPVPVVEGGTAWLLGRSEVHQVYAGAGHRTPIHRVVTLVRHEPNPADFAARLDAAHASGSVMLQDTAEGYRYLRRTADPEAPAVGAEPARRVPAGKAQRVSTLAAGVLVDPNIDHPLPFAGLGYVDFDFLGTGAQVNAFFGGAFAQLAFAVPSLAGTRLQLHGAGSATFVEYNDRSFRDGLEVYDENVRQRPARFAVGLLHPVGRRGRVRADYELGYTRYRRAGFADATFVPPTSTPVHGVRLALEAQQGPWSASLWWSGARRQRWTAWGLPGNPESEAGAIGFQRYGAELARAFVFSPRAVARAELGWMSGRNLDRFSRFSFDSFDNRLHGYPSAALRYDRGAVVRTAASWNACRFLRVDGFVDGAWVRDPGFGPREKGYLGVGAGLESAVARRLLVAVEWGYGFQARDRDGRPGAHVLRATVFRIF